MVDYSEVIGEDVEGRVLDAIAEGNFYVMVIMTSDDSGILGLRMPTNTPSAETARALLEKTLEVLP